MKYHEFLRITRLLNKQFACTPLLYGSVGLEQRLGTVLDTDDIDILIPNPLVTAWLDLLVSTMETLGYAVCDEKEHTFHNGSFHVAFARIESLSTFAAVDISQIPMIVDNGAFYLLLDLRAYLSVYRASSKDGYRKNIKHKQDAEKIKLITSVLIDNRSNR